MQYNNLKWINWEWSGVGWVGNELFFLFFL